MKKTERTVVIETFASELMPEITSERPGDAEIITWGDANPAAWKIVATNKSKAFGASSSAYLGCYQGCKASGSVIARLAHFRSLVLGLDPLYPVREEGGEDNIWWWRARFTLAHFGRKDFKSGTFRQHATWSDGKSYARHTLDLDYTDGTLEEVIDRFCRWMNSNVVYENTTHVELDGRVVRRFEKAKVAV